MAKISVGKGLGWLWWLMVPLLCGCHHTPDETLVRQGITTAADAAEHADASAMGDVLSDDFDGGELDRRRLLDMLRLARFRGETIHALTGPVEVEQRGDRYVAHFTVTLTSGGKLLPAQMGMYKVEAAWRRDGHVWHCYSATWAPM